jgi:hypothetical protein
VSLTTTAGYWEPYVNGLPAGRNIIPAMSAFLVRAYTNAQSFTMKNSHRVQTAGTGSIMRVARDPRTVISLNLENPSTNLSDQAIVYFENGATQAFNGGFDAQKFNHNVSGMPTVSSRVISSNYSIKGLPVLDSGEVIVPLNTILPATGSFRFNAASMQNVNNMEVYLMDSTRALPVNLKANPVYTFTGTQGNAGHRFALKFRKASSITGLTPSAGAMQFHVWPNPNNTQSLQLEYFQAEEGKTMNCTLINSLGQTVWSDSYVTGTQGVITLRTGKVAAGVYMLQTNVGGKVKTERVIFE